VSDGGSGYTISRIVGNSSDIVISDSGRQKIQVGGHGFPFGGQFGSR
jgi:hypothetical protein